MMRTSTAHAVAVIAGLMLASACSSPKPPLKDIDLAKTKLDAALASSAPSFAPEPLKAAQSSKKALDVELARQAAKWFKSYDLADDLAIEVQAAAEQALETSKIAREETIAAANSNTGEDRRGPNLFTNGDFADGLKEWSLHPQSDATVTVDGTGADRAWHVKFRKGNWSVIYQEFPLQPDTVYVYEATVKTTAPIVALYWQSEIGRYFQYEQTYPQWTRLRYVFITPRWDGKPYRVGFNPVLMKGPGDAWLKDLRISVFRSKDAPK